MTPTPPTPLVHLNGTSKDSLVWARVAVYDKLQVALESLKQMAPNARDYYPYGPGAFEVAVAKHRERQGVVYRLMNEIEAEIAAIEEQGK